MTTRRGQQKLLTLGDAARSAAIERQLVEQQREIDYDTKEFTVELLVQKFDAGDFFVPPYQREFIWSTERQSKFIESVILGLPIPFMFFAENMDGRLEIVDGAQRMNTLGAFMSNRLRLTPLRILTELSGCSLANIPISQQRKLKNRTIRMIVLTDKTSADSKFSIFERINTGSDTVRAPELRKGAYSGPFLDLITELSGLSNFLLLCPVGENPAKRGERQDLVLRFLAYCERYEKFSHDVAPFLDQFVIEKSELYKSNPAAAARDSELLKDNFIRMLTFVGRYFPDGFAKSLNAKTTPRVRFEAISVGVHLALRINPRLQPKSMAWLTSPEFERQTTTHGSNSGPRLRGRIEYVRDMLLG